MVTPQPVAEKLQELDRLVEDFPLNIPIATLAKFLGMDANCLKASMEHGNCPFGLAWKANSNRGFKVPTVPFYLWYTQRRM